MSLECEIEQIARTAKNAAKTMATLRTQQKNDALRHMAQALRDGCRDILASNAADMAAAREKNTTPAILDRLMLNETRVEAMAGALEDLIGLPDPVGRVLEDRKLDNGIELKRVSVPIGVVAIIYEARPNVTADAAGICIKSGNSCILRGGSLAARSNETIAKTLSAAAVEAGLPDGCICYISSTERAAADILMGLHGTVDVVIPRGGAGLISHCVETSKVPVIETGTGNCHVYIHESADTEIAENIVLNSKCRRYGVCNAAESLLVDANFDTAALKSIFCALASNGVILHCDDESSAIAASCNSENDCGNIEFVAADESDWGREYLAPEISVKIIHGGVSEAVTHINEYGTGHSEAIVSTDADAIREFLSCVDAAAVYANVATAFTDGGQFGLGAEIGISTQKLHVRGPFALEGLTSYKYVLEGAGQVRP